LFWVIVSLVIVAAIALGVTVSMWVIEYLSEPERVLAPEVASALIVDRQIPVGMQSTGDALLSQIRQTITDDASGLIQVYPLVATAAGETRPATTDEFLAAIPLQAPGTFIRNITNVTIAGTDPSAIAFVITYNDFETALGGMYRWEPNIIRDLGALFGSSPINRFIDGTTGNRDIRVAQRADGTELTYTFINRTTLLITNNRALIGEVVSRIQ
jgi:hypothetical protein